MLTTEQIRDMAKRAIDFHDGNEAGLIEGYKMGYADGVAAEQKRIMSVLAKMIDGDSPGDHAITEAMNQIERG